MTKVEISGIKVKIGETELTLTMEQAKELKAAMDELFKQTIYSYPTWTYLHPFYTNLQPYEWPKIWCNSDVQISYTTSGSTV